MSKGRRQREKEGQKEGSLRFLFLGTILRYSITRLELITKLNEKGGSQNRSLNIFWTVLVKTSSSKFNSR